MTTQAQSVSFHLNKIDAGALRGVANNHGMKSGLIRYSVQNCVLFDDKDMTAADVLVGQPNGPFTEKFNVVAGEWSIIAQETAEKLGVKRAELIRFAVHKFLVTSGYVIEA